MSLDWKDKLNALRSDLQDPSPEEIDSQIPTNNIEKTSIQKESLHVLIEKKGRNGKTATIIEGFTCPEKEIEDIARKLKQKLGVGGSCRGGEILIQGDRKTEVISFLKSLGFKTKG